MGYGAGLVMTVEGAFWAAASFVAYTYVGYPVLVWLASKARVSTVGDVAATPTWPRVTVVISAYNEEARIGRKLRNLLDLDYPKGLLSIIVVSDGSTDRTGEEVRRYPEVRLIELAARSGKAVALNVAMPLVDSPVALLCDVRQRIEPMALKYLVATLLQRGVGAVGGQLHFEDADTGEAEAVGLYWQYETWIRASESRLHSSVGLTGALYAVRTGLFPVLSSKTVADDLEAPLAIVRNGHRTIVDDRAVATDQLQKNVTREFQRKVRTLTGNFVALSNWPALLNPFLNPVWIQFMSHKIFRLFVPYALIVMQVASLLSNGSFYRAMALLQFLFYGVALLPTLVPSVKGRAIGSFARTFVVLNAAAVLGLFRYAFGPVGGRWEKTS